MNIHHFTATETAGGEIPQGMQRISLARLNATGDFIYQVKDHDGRFYLCDLQGENIGLAAGWTLLRPLADIAAGDSPALLEVIQGPSSSHELR